MPVLNVGNRSIHVDNDGYLKNFDEWDEHVARALAQREGIELGEEHMEIVRFVRDFFAEHKTAPMLTYLTRKSGVSFRRLHQMFGKQPGKRAAKLAGLPKTTGCT